MWHTDLSWLDALPRGSILRAVVLPPYGGDTMWANTAAAYRDLPQRLRVLADKRWVLHSNASKFVSNRADEPDQKSEDHAFWTAFQSTVYHTRHPLAHVHPETGEPCLLLGQFVRRVVGTTAAQTATLYQTFQRYITRPENTVRWRWAVGDVAVYDNRSTQHYAIADYGEAPRVMRRVSMDGALTGAAVKRSAPETTRSGPHPVDRRPVECGALATRTGTEHERCHSLPESSHRFSGRPVCISGASRSNGRRAGNRCLEARRRVQNETLPLGRVWPSESDS
jgi:alpha-ketoglutarate-dependent sulfate ester dioxygenase